MDSWPGLDEARKRLLSSIPVEFGEYVVYEEPPPTNFERLREILEEFIWVKTWNVHHLMDQEDVYEEIRRQVAAMPDGQILKYEKDLLDFCGDLLPRPSNTPHAVCTHTGVHLCDQGLKSDFIMELKKPYAVTRLPVTGPEYNFVDNFPIVYPDAYIRAVPVPSNLSHALRAKQGLSQAGGKPKIFWSKKCDCGPGLARHYDEIPSTELRPHRKNPLSLWCDRCRPLTRPSFDGDVAKYTHGVMMYQYAFSRGYVTLPLEQSDLGPDFYLAALALFGNLQEYNRDEEHNLDGEDDEAVDDEAATTLGQNMDEESTSDDEGDNAQSANSQIALPRVTNSQLQNSQVDDDDAPLNLNYGVPSRNRELEFEDSDDEDEPQGRYDEEDDSNDVKNMAEVAEEQSHLLPGSPQQDPSFLGRRAARNALFQQTMREALSAQNRANHTLDEATENEINEAALLIQSDLSTQLTPKTRAVFDAGDALPEVFLSPEKLQQIQHARDMKDAALAGQFIQNHVEELTAVLGVADPRFARRATQSARYNQDSENDSDGAPTTAYGKVNKLKRQRKNSDDDGFSEYEASPKKARRGNAQGRGSSIPQQARRDSQYPAPQVRRTGGKSLPMPIAKPKKARGDDSDDDFELPAPKRRNGGKTLPKPTSKSKRAGEVDSDDDSNLPKPKAPRKKPAKAKKPKPQSKRCESSDEDDDDFDAESSSSSESSGPSPPKKPSTKKRNPKSKQQSPSPKQDNGAFDHGGDNDPGASAPNESRSALNEVSEPKKSGGTTWTKAEHDAIFDIIYSRRMAEAADKSLRPLRDKSFFIYMSENLALRGIHRKPLGCKSYWNRYGRKDSGFEERLNVPPGTSLVSSEQKPKSKGTKKSKKEDPNTKDPDPKRK